MQTSSIAKPSRRAVVRSLLGLVVCVLLMAFGVYSLPRLQTHYSVMQFLPDHHPALQMDEAVRERFGLTDLPLFIALIHMNPAEQGNWFDKKRVDELDALTKAVGALPGVQKALTLANVDGAADTNHTLNVGPLLSLLPESQWQKRVLNDALLSPGLVTADGKTTVVYAQLESGNVETLVEFQAAFKNLQQKFFSQDKWEVGGVPAVQTDLGLLLNKELRNFLLLTFLACAVALILIFESVSTLFIPLFLTLFANLMVFALMAWTGLTFTILSATIPVLVFITVVSISAHILLRLAEDAHHDEHNLTKWQLIVKANREILAPNFLGALTSCVGFLTLLHGDVPLIRDYGIGVASAVGLAWFLTSAAIIPLLVLFPFPRPRAWVRRPARWALLTIHYRKWVVSAGLLLSVLMVLGGQHLSWTGRLFDDLPKGQEARRATESIDQAVGGVIPLDVVAQAPTEDMWKEPASLQQLAKLVDEIRTLPGVGSALSVPDMLRAFHMDGAADLPATRQAVAEMYFLYSMGGNNPLDAYLSKDGKASRIQIKLHDLPSNQMRHLVDVIQARAEQLLGGAEIQVGGMGAVAHIIHDELSHELIFGFWQALAFILVLLSFLFRSLRWALVACLPNLMPPLALLAFLGLTGTPIKPGVAIIFSIALGLAFNNTVYLFNRIRALPRKAGRLQVAKAFYFEGNPCLVSTLIVLVGFSVFLMSYFPLNQTFGECMMISILAGLIGDLIVLPAFLAWVPIL